MTKEDWAEVEEHLGCVGWRVRLNCDGHSVVLVRGRVKEMRDGIGVLINGALDAEWVKRDCEERKRFACPKKYYTYDKKSREMWKQLGPAEQKRIAKHEGPNFDINATGVAYTLIWSNFKQLKTHLIKNNKEISIIREEVA